MHLRRKFLRLSHNDYHNSSSNCGGTGSVGLGYLFLLKSEKKRSPCDHPLHYGEYDEQNTYKVLSKINHRPIKMRMGSCTTYCTLVGSCNGLICLFEPERVEECYCVADPVYICNPVTGESVNLPRLSIQIPYKSIPAMVCGFGYLPSTNEYKVVRIYFKNGTGHVQVYTLGSSNGWRNRGEMAAYSPFLRTGILANGALHWLVTKRREQNGPNFVVPEKRNILAFDLADETFHMVPSPPCFHFKYEFEVQVLGGWLCVVHTKTSEQSLDIWLLKKTKNKKPTTNSIEEIDDKYYESWSWSKDYTIDLKSMEFGSYKPFGFTRNGEVLILGFDSCGLYQRLLRYDPNTSNLEKLNSINYLAAIPHMNSFVSLDVIGEKCEERKICTSKKRKRPNSGQNVRKIAYF